MDRRRCLRLKGQGAFYMDMDPEKTLDPGMRAIFFPVQSYQIRRQNRQRFRGVRLLTPNSFLNDRTAQTDRTKRKRTLPYGRHIESGRKGAKSSFRLKCRFTSSSDLALFAQDAGAKPLYCSSDSVPSNSSRMPRTTPARAAITIMALIRTTIHFVFCIGGGTPSCSMP